ncbi:MAG: Hsp20/alpha crystallin family protein [Alphaproteobacteria bacterium]
MQAAAPASIAFAVRPRWRRVPAMVEKSELSRNTPDWWSQFFAPVRQFGERVAEFFAPSSEAAATPEAYEVSIELPGVSDADIHAEIRDGRLTISGEKKASREEKGKDFYFSERVYGSFRRTFRLPDDADTDRIQAVHKDGVLTVTIPKRVPTAPEAKKIRIERP